MIYEFKSGFAGLIQGMLAQRAVLGYSVKHANKMLANFDRFCTTRFPDENILTKEIAFAWCNDAKGNGGFNRASALRGFARYILQTDETAYIMPPSFFPAPKARQPLIMNHAELANFFKATNCYPSSKKNALNVFTVPVIFRLQFACGMRPQEARYLRCVDFNFTDNTIYISEGKHRKDRCLPVNKDVMDMCRRYNRLAETVFLNRTYFFQAQPGNACSSGWLCNAFHICWEISGKMPAAVPVRHTFSVIISPHRNSCAGLKRERIWMR